MREYNDNKYRTMIYLLCSNVCHTGYRMPWVISPPEGLHWTIQTIDSVHEVDWHWGHFQRSRLFWGFRVAGARAARGAAPGPLRTRRLSCAAALVLLCCKGQRCRGCSTANRVSGAIVSQDPKVLSNMSIFFLPWCSNDTPLSCMSMQKLIEQDFNPNPRNSELKDLLSYAIYCSIQSFKQDISVWW